MISITPLLVLPFVKDAVPPVADGRAHRQRRGDRVARNAVGVEGADAVVRRRRIRLTIGEHMIGFLRAPEAACGLGGINGNLFAVDRDGLDVSGRLDRQRRRAALADVAAPLCREVLGLQRSARARQTARAQT